MEIIMNLHENSDTFRDAIRAASEYLGIRDVFVEKDYWVTFILKRLPESEYSGNVVFKGGTSLSKVHKLYIVNINNKKMPSHLALSTSIVNFLSYL
jgi:hypothetical protein